MKPINSKPLPFLLLLVLACMPCLAATQSFTYRNDGGLRKVVDIGTENLRERPEAISLGGSERYRASGVISCRWINATTNKFMASRHTATLIENGFILATDAHSFVTDEGVPKANRDDCDFTIYDANGEALQSARIKKIRVYGRGLSKAETSGINAPNDWAVVTLQTEVTKAVPFEVATHGKFLNLNDRIQLCSYSADLKTVSNVKGDYQKRCLSGTFRNSGTDDPTLGNVLTMLHDISTGGMSSGAGIFTDHDSEKPPVLYAIHAGGGRWDESSQTHQCKSADHKYNIALCSNYANFFSDAFYESLTFALNDTGGSRYKR